jgi:leucyl aminopeptidase
VLRIRLAPAPGAPAVLALPVGGDDTGLLPVEGVPAELTGLAAALVADTEHTGAAGTVQVLPRPGAAPRRLVVVGVGAGDEAGWRTAGAALARTAQKDEQLTVALPSAAAPEALRGLVEGLLLASYRFRLVSDDPDSAPKLHRVTVSVADPDAYADVLATAAVTAELTYLARDLTNWPSLEKTPAWFASRITRAAARLPYVTATVRDPAALRAEGFGGILAVGQGSDRGPRLVELTYRPPGAEWHVVLVGKGITFDTGGISLKSRDGMKLMRKDMGGAAAVVAAALGAARLGLPVRVTALAPLAENMVSGDAYRPGDVIRHYGGRTSEILNTDAEGRIVLADALAYAVQDLHPDVLVDLATLTGANAVALGKRTAALYAEDDELAEQLAEAAEAAGERVWRMPLPDDYVELFSSEVADVANVTRESGAGAGSITAALFLREFVGMARDRWVHLDMSAPSWADGPDGELVKGATGWGVRLLLRWLTETAHVTPPERRLTGAARGDQTPPGRTGRRGR